MLILGLDTATDVLAVGVGDGERALAEQDVLAPRAHMSRLLPTVHEMLTRIDVGLAEIDYLAVGIGPGSFTGVRIGVATARGLAQGLDKPLVAVPTPDIIAAGAVSERQQLSAIRSATSGGEPQAPDEPPDAVCTVIDAKRGEVYATLYSCVGASCVRTSEHQVLYPEDLADKLASEQLGRVLLVGDGLRGYGDLMVDRLGGRAVVTEPNQWTPRASVLIRLAAEKIKAGGVEPYFQVLPIYLRLSDAEEALKRKRLSKTSP